MHVCARACRRACVRSCVRTVVRVLVCGREFQRPCVCVCPTGDTRRCWPTEEPMNVRGVPSLLPFVVPAFTRRPTRSSNPLKAPAIACRTPDCAPASTVRTHQDLQPADSALPANNQTKLNEDMEPADERNIATKKRMSARKTGRMHTSDQSKRRSGC